MRIPNDGGNPFETLMAHIRKTIEIEQAFVQRFERHRRIDALFALSCFALAVFFLGDPLDWFTGTWIGWVYLALGVGMVGMALHAQYQVIRTSKWIEDWQIDLALFQLGANEYERGEWPEWVLRKAEASGRYFFSEG